MISGIQTSPESQILFKPSLKIWKGTQSTTWEESSFRSLEGGTNKRNGFSSFFTFVFSFFAGIWFVISSCFCCFRKNKEVETAQVTAKFLGEAKISFSAAIDKTKQKLSDPKSAEITLKTDDGKLPKQSIQSASSSQILEPLDAMCPREDDVRLGVEPTPLSRVEAKVRIFYGEEGTEKKDLHCKAYMKKGKFHASSEEIPPEPSHHVSKSKSPLET